MKDSETLRQAIEFLKERPMPDVKMGDILRLYDWWESLHKMAASAFEKERTSGEIGATGQEEKSNGA